MAINRRTLGLVCLVLLIGRDAAAEQPAQGKEKPLQQTHITISKATTRIVEPLTKDGYPNYIRAINEQMSRGVTPENNAAVALLKAIGPAKLDADLRAEYFTRLGIKPLPVDADYFETFDEYIQRVIKDPDAIETAGDEFYEAMQTPWTDEDYPHIARWLEKNDKHLEAITQASNRSRYYMPLLTSTDSEQTPMLVAVLLPNLSQPRDIARGLAVRSMYKLGGGNAESAWSDVKAGLQLGRLVGQGSTIIESLVSSAIKGIAWQGVAPIIQHGKLTAKQANLFRAQLVALPPQPHVLERIDSGERYAYLDCVCWLARVGPKVLNDIMGGDASEPQLIELQRTLANTTIDWNVVLKMGNHYYDRLVAAGKLESADQRKRALQKFDADLKKMAGAAKKGALGIPLLLLGGEQGKEMISKQVGGILIALLLPALNTVIEVEHRDETRMRMADLALALAAYRDRHKAYPDKLSDLTPQDVKQIPTDAISDGAFRYRRQDDGFILYSLGPNAMDDDGRTGDDDPEGDDIVLRTVARAD
jgi:hypothetical protein